MEMNSSLVSILPSWQEFAYHPTNSSLMTNKWQKGEHQICKLCHRGCRSLAVQKTSYTQSLRAFVMVVAATAAATVDYLHMF
jgi:hypothetical protein